MASKSAWTGWIAFAAILMMVIGALDVFEGLIAVIRDKYYALAPQSIIVFDVSTWGWINLIWGSSSGSRATRCSWAGVGHAGSRSSSPA